MMLVEGCWAAGRCWAKIDGPWEEAGPRVVGLFSPIEVLMDPHPYKFVVKYK